MKRPDHIIIIICLPLLVAACPVIANWSLVPGSPPSRIPGSPLSPFSGSLRSTSPLPGFTGPSHSKPGRSFFPLRPEDPTALYFTPEKFNIKADGSADVSAALQAALREVKTRYNFGILFIPEGKYLMTKTIYIPTAVRLIGYGKERPLFLLGKNSPGFQTADPNDKGHAKYMFWFVNNLYGRGQPIDIYIGSGAAKSAAGSIL